MKSKDLENSIWGHKTEDYRYGFMHIRKVKGGWYGICNKYDLEAKTIKEMLADLKKDGFEHIGWE